MKSSPVKGLLDDDDDDCNPLMSPELDSPNQNDSPSDQLSDSTDATRAVSKYDLLDHVFTFITEVVPGEEINPLLSGYFCKLVTSLLNYKKKEFLSYFFNKQGLLEAILSHLYDKSLSDLVVKILNNSETAVSTRKQSEEDDGLACDQEDVAMEM